MSPINLPPTPPRRPLRRTFYLLGLLLLVLGSAVLLWIKVAHDDALDRKARDEDFREGVRQQIQQRSGESLRLIGGSGGIER